ncbi:MAG TPA: NAD(P)H-hydrate dehydratase [Candidatus Baltobacteraceae bacterium]
MLVLTPQQMRDADASASARIGDVALMRAAGARIAQTIVRYARGRRIVAFAGPGNNGGDAFAALAVLDSFYERHVYARRAENPSAARRDAENRAGDAGVVVHELPRDAALFRAALEGCGLAIDALFGTGARIPLPAEYADAISALDACDAPVLAVDIPSGIDALTGAVPGTAVRATVTITLGALKPGLLLDPARDYAGDLWYSSIGIEDGDATGATHTFAALDDATFLPMLPQRPQNSDKRRSGAPLLLAGSAQFPGAAVLSARAAARAGAGYVTIVTGESAAPAIRAHLVEQVAVTISAAQSASDAIDEIVEVAKHATSFGMGPGLGLDERTGDIVRGVAARLDLPFVADASALFHFAKHMDILRGKRCVLTPHAGEFARLSGKGTVKESERVERLREFVDRTGVTTLLKGRTTLIYDGTTMHLNTTGTNALATAGTGDVLTGIIATLLSQGLSPIDAARAGAYWHGLTGKYCAGLRERGVIAGDLPDALAAALPTPQPPANLYRIF